MPIKHQSIETVFSEVVVGITNKSEYAQVFGAYMLLCSYGSVTFIAA